MFDAIIISFMHFYSFINLWFVLL